MSAYSSLDGVCGGILYSQLFPQFSPTFPSTCLAPDQPGYGQVVPTGQKTRRVRRPLRTPIMEMPRAPTSWKVVTPNQESHRFGGYNNYPLSSYRNTAPLPPPPPPPSSKAGLSLDTSSEPRLKEEFNLPPIQAPDSNSSSSSPYSLPPISSMEEIRNVADSAAVLRRLRMDDDGYNKAEERTWLRRHSSSAHSSSPYVPFFIKLLSDIQETHKFLPR